jgi:hypothetical protein
LHVEVDRSTRNLGCPTSLSGHWVELETEHF